MLTISIEEIEKKATRLAERLNAIEDSRLEISLVRRSSKAGGGALPLLDLASQCISVKLHGISTSTVEKDLRENNPPIIGRIEEDNYIMDLRTIQEDEIPILETAFANLLKRTAR